MYDLKSLLSGSTSFRRMHFLFCSLYKILVRFVSLNQWCFLMLWCFVIECLGWKCEKCWYF